jgi:hypothetical protein
MEQVMSSRVKLIGLIVAIATISGCAGMSSDECVASDWSAIGYEDGSRGYTTDRFGNHRKACAKHGVTADFQSYQKGREQGLVEYCQPSRGYNVGVNGGSYYGVCDVNQEADFLDAYNSGHHLYTLRSNVNHATSSINAKNNELERIENRLIANGIEMISVDTTQEQRIYLLAELKNLAERTGQLEAEVEELYEVRARSRAELENYQLTVADTGY